VATGLVGKQKSEGFENIQEKLIDYSISTEFFEAGGRWPVWLFIAARGQKSKQ